MRNAERVRVSLLPEVVPRFMDNGLVKAKGEIALRPDITSVVKGTITLNDKSLFFLAANLFRANQSFELRLKKSEWGSEFSQISLPRQKRPNPPTRINAWWPKYGKDEKSDDYDKEYLTYTFATMLVKAFRRPETEKPFDGIEAYCYSLDPISRLKVEVEVRIRKRILAKYPKLLP